MTEFVRVRSKGGPDQEYDAPAARVAAHPELYVVVKPKPADGVKASPAPAGEVKRGGKNRKEEDHDA